jgi:HK97 family phage portal protein
MLGLRSPRRAAPFGTHWMGGWGTWPDAMRRVMKGGVPQPSETVLPSVADWSVMGIPAAWRCAVLVSDSIASLPMFAYSESDDGEEAKITPTPPVLMDPWPMISYHDWVFGVVWSLLLRGDAFALPAYPDPATGYPRQWVLLNPDEVWVDLGPDNLPRYSVGDMELGPAEILHIRGVCPPGSVRGIGVIEAHRRGFTALLAMDAYAIDSYTTAGVPSGVVTVDRPELGETQAADLKARWQAAFNGKREPAVVPRSITFQPLAFSPSDMAYIEARKLGATEVCWMFGVHPMVIGAPAGTSMTYGNVEATHSAFATDSLIGWSGRIEQALSKWLPKRQVAHFNYDAFLRGTTLERYQAHQIGLEIGLETLNEARDVEHLPRYTEPEADTPKPLQKAAAPRLGSAIPSSPDGAGPLPLQLVTGAGA